MIITIHLGISKIHVRYAILNQAIISIILNFVINGFITWFYFRTDDEIPLFGLKSISMDIIQANFYFTFYTCFFITRAVYGGVIDGRISPIYGNPKFIKKYPSGYFFGSILLGIFVSLLFTPVIVGTMMLFEVQSFRLTEFIVFKAIWGAIMATIWAPIFTLIALSEAEHINEAPNSIWQVSWGLMMKIKQ